MRLHGTLLLAHLLAATSTAAPVPKSAPPPALADVLAGDWVFEWRGHWDGRDPWVATITLRADGSYSMRVNDAGPDDPTYLGTWRVDGARITFREASWRPDREQLGTGYDYTIAVSAFSKSAVDGKANGTRVALTKHPK